MKADCIAHTSRDTLPVEDLKNRKQKIISLQNTYYPVTYSIRDMEQPCSFVMEYSSSNLLVLITPFSF